MRGALEPLRRTADANLQRLVLALEAAATHQRADTAAAIAPATVDRTGIELFERERGARRVFSCTDPAALA